MAKHAMRLYLTAHERWKTSVKIDATSTKKVPLPVLSAMLSSRQQLPFICSITCDAMRLRQSIWEVMEVGAG
eukprot:3841475-Rhodomonas_salina.1